MNQIWRSKLIRGILLGLVVGYLAAFALGDEWDRAPWAGIGAAIGFVVGLVLDSVDVRALLPRKSSTLIRGTLFGLASGFLAACAWADHWDRTLWSEIGAAIGLLVGIVLDIVDVRALLGRTSASIAHRRWRFGWAFRSRDLLWFVLVCAMGVAWWLDRINLRVQSQQVQWLWTSVIRATERDEQWQQVTGASDPDDLKPAGLNAGGQAGPVQAIE